MGCLKLRRSVVEDANVLSLKRVDDIRLIAICIFNVNTCKYINVIVENEINM